MEKKILFLLLAVLAIAGCRQGYRYDDGIEYVSDDAPVVEQCARSAGCTRCVVSGGVADCGASQQVVKYSVPNESDLRLESARHVIQINGEPGKKYDYYVWTGEKTYADAPDLIVQDGAASVRVEQ